MNTLASLRTSAWGWSAFLLPLALYVVSVSPYVSFWDTAEMQTVPYILGIAHPTGFPLFVLVGWVFTHVFAFGTVAWRMGVLCSIAMAGAARLVYSLARLLETEPPVALGAALLFAVGNVAWTRGTRAEVHAFVAFFAALALLSAARWYVNGNAGALRWLGLAIGLGLATHLVIGLLFPGLAIVVFARARDLTLRNVAVPVLLAVCSLSLYAYLPLRSAYVTKHRLDPTLALGLPPGRPYWDYAHPASLAGMRRELAGSDFNVGQGLKGILSPGDYDKMASAYVGTARAEFGWFVLAASVLGLGFVLRGRPLLGIGLATAVALPIPFAISYLAESDVERYFLPSFWLIAALAGVGIDRVVAAYMRERSMMTSVLASLTVAVFVGQNLLANRTVFAQRNDDQAERYVARVIATTPNNAILISNWAYATSLAYAAYVERRLGNRIIETAWVGDDMFYLHDWIRKRPVYAIVQNEPPDDSELRFTEVDRGFPSIMRVSK